MLKELNLYQTGLMELSYNELNEVSGGGPIMRLLGEYVLGKAVDWIISAMCNHGSYSGSRPDPAHVSDNTYVAHDVYYSTQ